MRTLPWAALPSQISSGISAEAYDELLGDTYYGQMFGNLITLGTLHLAPEGPELDAFVAHAAAVSATWRNGSYFRVRTHASEDEGVRWIDAHTGERAWGLIVFNSVAEGDVDYTLRCGGHRLDYYLSVCFKCTSKGRNIILVPWPCVRATGSTTRRCRTPGTW